MRTLLYYSPGACSLAPHILLEETGTDYDLIEVNVQQGKTQEKEFLKVNPKGRVPVLLCGDQIITEVPAICWYIGTQHPERRVFVPHTVLGQARALEWFNWLSGTLHGVAFGGKWRPQRFASHSASQEDVRAKADSNLRDGFHHIEQQLAGRQWALGDGYSVVDPYLFVFYNWAKAIGVDVRTTYPQWHVHAERMLSRPAVREAKQQERL